ncbi:NADH-quinone oxidoreductase subunit N [Candidatus Sumerlaeota bacterium]|nr:NADH-quinone oxidoreductase subunit N [Candidatus Sumerlaeota bacterium]
MTFSEILVQLRGVYPELVLSILICAVIGLDMLVPLRLSRVACGLLSLAGTSLALLFAFVEPGRPGMEALTFGAAVTHDRIAAFFRILLLLGASASFLFLLRSDETVGYRQGEYCALILGAVLGACFLVSSDNLVLFVVGLETLSLCSYVLAGFLKHERLSAEASLKYVIYGGVASGVMLFGLSYFYGLTGTLSIEACARALLALDAGGPSMRLAAAMILLLILAGVGFKIAMVPFHFWCPDIYQGAPTPVTAFLAVVSKGAGFGALLRLLSPFFAASTPALTTFDVPVLFGCLAVVTMTFGNLVAIRQGDVKRLLAYSSIAHAGYLLLGFTVAAPVALEAILFYLFVYLFMTFGAFWVVVVLVNRLGSSSIDAFRGTAAKAPFLFAALFVCLISLTGIPPTAGFAGKFMLFKLVVGAGIDQMAAGARPLAAFYFFLALAGVLNSAISLYYYMRIARAMVFDKSEGETPMGEDFFDRAGAAVFALPTLALLYFTPVLDLIRWTAR